MFIKVDYFKKYVKLYYVVLIVNVFALLYGIFVGEIYYKFLGNTIAISCWIFLIKNAKTDEDMTDIFKKMLILILSLAAIFYILGVYSD